MNSTSLVPNALREAVEPEEPPKPKDDKEASLMARFSEIRARPRSKDQARQSPQSRSLARQAKPRLPAAKK
jgi:hypothetical protein